MGLRVIACGVDLNLWYLRYLWVCVCVHIEVHIYCNIILYIKSDDLLFFVSLMIYCSYLSTSIAIYPNHYFNGCLAHHKVTYCLLTNPHDEMFMKCLYVLGSPSSWCSRRLNSFLRMLGLRKLSRSPLILSDATFTVLASLFQLLSSRQAFVEMPWFLLV